MREILINGRYLTQRPTGVQRFAAETVRAIDGLLGTDRYGNLRVSLLAPPGTADPGLARIRFRTGGRAAGGYGWEQLDLPRLARGGVLLGLCNLGPVVMRRQVVVIHDATPRVMPANFSRGFRLAYRVLIPALGLVAARLFTISAFSRAEIARHYGIAPQRFRICAEGGEHILRTPAEPAILTSCGVGQAPYFVAVGVGSSNKNVDTVMAAFDRAAIPGARLVMTGKRAAHVHGASTEIAAPAVPAHCYAGHVSDGELRALYEGALALIYPSRYEGFGLPPLEAMCCGCPVVISDQPALLEVAGLRAAGEEGPVLVTGMDDVAGLSTLMQRLAADTELRQRLAASGQARAAQFNWAATGAGLLDACLELA